MSAQRLLKSVISRSDRKFKGKFEKLIEHHKNETVKSIIEKLLPCVPLSSVVDFYENTLLHLAAKYNNVDLIIFFANSGCNVNARNNSSETSLSTAFFCNHVESVDTLLNLGAVLSADDVEYILRALIDKKYDLPELKIMALMQILKGCTDIKTMARVLVEVNCPLKLIVSMGDASLTQTILNLPYKRINNNKDIAEALEYVMKVADIENLRVLLQSDRLVARRDYLFNELRHHIFESSSNFEYQTIFKQLNKWISYDRDFEGFLWSIFESTDKSTLRILLHECNIDVQIKQNYQFDVLPMLFSNWNVDDQDVIELTCKRQFDINARSFKGQTALHFAVVHDLINNVRLLLEMGADCKIKDDRGFTAFDLIHSVECCEIFLQENHQLRIGENHESKVLRIMNLDNDSTSDNLWTILLAQLAVESCQGVKITRRIVENINSYRMFKNYYNNCLKQVKSLKSFEILPSLTLFSVLTSKVENLSMYIRNRETVSKITQWCSRQTLHSFYCSSLQLNLEKAYNVYLARCQIASIIYENTSVLIYYDDLVIDKIFGYLVYRDMFMLASAWNTDSR